LQGIQVLLHEQMYTFVGVIKSSRMISKLRKFSPHREVTDAKFLSENLKRRDHAEDVKICHIGRIILKWIVRWGFK